MERNSVINYSESAQENWRKYAEYLCFGALQISVRTQARHIKAENGGEETFEKKRELEQ